MENVPESVNYFALLGIVLGVFLRTTGPYLIRLSAGSVPFDYRYLTSALVAAILGTISAGWGLALRVPSLPWDVSLLLCIPAGYGLQAAIREIEKLAKRKWELSWIK